MGFKAGGFVVRLEVRVFAAPVAAGSPPSPSLMPMVFLRWNNSMIDSSVETWRFLVVRRIPDRLAVTATMATAVTSSVPTQSNGAVEIATQKRVFNGMISRRLQGSIIAVSRSATRLKIPNQTRILVRQKQADETAATTMIDEDAAAGDDDYLFRCVICGTSEADAANITSNATLQTNATVRCGHQL
jgi:hypothetical protein